VEVATERWPQSRRGRVSVPAQAALSGSHNQAPGSAGGIDISFRMVCRDGYCGVGDRPSMDSEPENAGTIGGRSAGRAQITTEGYS
jgi:hypothetical protein